jgi:protein-disulfide isomerase
MRSQADVEVSLRGSDLFSPTRPCRDGKVCQEKTAGKLDSCLLACSQTSTSLERNGILPLHEWRDRYRGLKKLLRKDPLKHRVPLLFSILCAALSPTFGLAEGQPRSDEQELAALRKEVAELRQAVADIGKELGEMRNLLRARLASPRTEVTNVVFHIDDATPAEGNQSASLVLIEFSDYQCPVCEAYVREIYPQIKRDYIDTGKLRYVLFDFPLAAIHKDAIEAAEAAHCAGEQGKLWEMRRMLFQNQSSLAHSNYLTFAAALGLDTVRFEQCLGSGRYISGLNERVAEATRSGVRGTPSLAFGFAEGDGRTIKVDSIYRGDPPYPFLRQTITNLLALGVPEQPPGRK